MTIAEQISVHCKILDPKPGQILVARFPEGKYARDETMKIAAGIMQKVEEAGGPGCLTVLFLPEGYDFTVIDKAELQKLIDEK